MGLEFLFGNEAGDRININPYHIRTGFCGFDYRCAAANEWIKYG